MIITRIIGGLGNQMFQYAVGRALSISRRLPLYLDISSYRHYRRHQGFELQCVFNCNASLASTKDVYSVLGWRAMPIIKNLISRIDFSILHTDSFVVEPHLHYWPGICNVPDRVYLQGYWQSEKYFSDTASVIRSDFTFKQPMSAVNAAWAKKISSCISVSLHIRRGDYASHARTYVTHGLCSLDYYHAAVGYVAERTREPEFFVFSDDISWARDNLKLNYRCHYLDHNQGKESYNDMRLMSLCRHHIIANSTFSWWGAWLNPCEEKIVVAPARWFASGARIDLIPEGWVQI